MGVFASDVIAVLYPEHAGHQIEAVWPTKPGGVIGTDEPIRWKCSCSAEGVVSQAEATSVIRWKMTPTS